LFYTQQQHQKKNEKKKLLVQTELLRNSPKGQVEVQVPSFKVNPNLQVRQ